MKPMTVKIPPMIAHTDVKNWYNGTAWLDEQVSKGKRSEEAHRYGLDIPARYTRRYTRAQYSKDNQAPNSLRL